ncbi:L-2-amino-thiazoline-4-carboxylic acid hydrolase [Oscillibacter sp. MSJ-2]|uniref:L-2-amino-thiazoline-4-carboxylic acid hydrolase n=1 Tax=Dysosmobacter acutus TaxID=2841504 RepID=A0ABS6F9Q6_9FIRM|nr:L-2-amino-thiazoline-4-carboxylic acid hydrolase [Dysosmobacter acutus]MBU5626034.1 L-2-amino-thiazoline-4-carboxylic acid hydrolase [Dysosmobacter acutus]
MTQKQPILLTETHHGGILVAFYKVLMDFCGRERGYDLFMTAGRTYGARRGRRMAMRAMRDGNPLDLTSYFAYGELLCNDEGLNDEGTYEAIPGTVHEHQTDCWWAREFRAMDCEQCGVDYCKEIDGAVVRGFNPTMGFERTQNMHLNSSCDFYFHSPEVKSDFMSTYETRLKPGQCVKREMAYHCADVYQMYCHVITQVLPNDAAGLIEQVRAILSERYGKDFLPVLDSYSGTDFEQI